MKIVVTNICKCFNVVQAFSLFANTVVQKPRLFNLKFTFPSSLPQLCKRKDNCILIDD